MTQHLTDEQLGATRDGALSGAAAVAADRHLAACAECRARLHELATLDAALVDALEFDPGEAYFASFANRVAARIASETPAAAPAPAPRRGFATWWNSPRSLAWAGGALGLVAVTALVVTLAQQHGPQEMAAQVAPQRQLAAPPPAAGTNEEAAPQAASDAAPPANAPSSAEQPHASLGTLAKREALSTDPRAKEKLVPSIGEAKLGMRGDAAPRAASPMAESAPAPVAQSEVMQDRARGTDASVQEVRTLPNGEQAPVQRKALGAAQPPALKLPSGFSKPGAAPLGGQSFTDGARKSAAPAVPAPAAAPLSDNMVRVERDGGSTESVASVAVCGVLHDTRGRVLPRATVIVQESGATAVADASGAFCVDVPEAGATLSVLAVGYRPLHRTVSARDAGAALALSLAAVDVLAPSPASPPAVESFSAREGLARRETGSRSLAREAAIAASALALRSGTAAAWTLAAQRWETVAAIEGVRSDAEPGYHAAEARVNAWLVGHTEPQKDAARKAVQAYLDHAAPGASRDVATGWARALER